VHTRGKISLYLRGRCGLLEWEHSFWPSVSECDFARVIYTRVDGASLCADGSAEARGGVPLCRADTLERPRRCLRK
jgi:hypothetical protein